MNHEHLKQLVARFPGHRITVAGDLMLDRYVFGDAERVSPEAPVPVLRVVERQERVGGAGSVALNLVGLGASVRCIGLVGEDSDGGRVESLLGAAGVDTSGVIRTGDRPTITKTRLIGLAEHRHRQQMLRVDDELLRPPSPAHLDRLFGLAPSSLEGAHALCLEDYAKGLLTDEFCQRMIGLARRANIPVFVDPSRGGGWTKYVGASVLTPNRAEFELAAGRRLPDDELAPAARQMLARLQLGAIAITLGRDGVLLVEAGGERRFPTRPRAVYDNTGAGDAVLAMLALAVAAGGGLDDAIRLANLAGGIEVSKFGCVPITVAEVLAELSELAATGAGKIRGVSEIVADLAPRRHRGETVVFTNGCFDLLHPGHVELLERAKALGSLLVVGLNSDASIRQLGKGGDRPIRQQMVRARMLAALQAVDYVTIFDEPDPVRLIEAISPDVLVKGADWAGKPVVGGDWVQSRGGRVVLIDLVEGFSTTGELDRIRAGIARGAAQSSG